MAQDIDTSLDAMASVFGAALERPTPFVIKRTRYSKNQPIVEFYAGMHRSDRNWSEQPVWGHISAAVGFETEAAALNLITLFGLKPRAEVVERDAVQNNGR
jgi:hypothetical protein